jgi:surface polysaccharide O-acyltransferase-like enzyme
MSNHSITWIRDLRSTAIFGVVLLHVAYNSNHYLDIPKVDWWASLIYSSSVRFCVPIFVMLTGALMLSREYVLKDFLNKKFIRLIFPFLFWGSIYLIWDLSMLKDSSTLLSISKVILNNVYASGISFHLWYVYMIIGLYLFIPILSKWTSTASDSELLYLLCIWFIICHLEQYEMLKLKLELRYFSGYIGYLVLGHFFYKKTFKSNIQVRRWSGILYFVGLIATILGTNYLTAKNQFYAPSFLQNSFSLNIMCLSIGIFLSFKYAVLKPCSIRDNVSEQLSKYSYGIYLSHILVLRFWTAMGINPLSIMPPVVGIPLFTILCIFFSWLLVLLVEKLPFGKYLAT